MERSTWSSKTQISQRYLKASLIEVFAIFYIKVLSFPSAILCDFCTSMKYMPRMMYLIKQPKHFRILQLILYRAILFGTGCRLTHRKFNCTRSSMARVISYRLIQQQFIQLIKAADGIRYIGWMGAIVIAQNWIIDGIASSFLSNNVHILKIYQWWIPVIVLPIFETLLFQAFGCWTLDLFMSRTTAPYSLPRLYLEWLTIQMRISGLTCSLRESPALS